MYDVAIVGGGPIGSFIGKEIASLGYDVVIFEEHSEIGNPSHCSGLFSTNIFNMVGKIGILHPAKKAVIYAPDGSKLRIGDDKVRGYVVDRVRFDRELAKMAGAKGAEIHLKERVKKVKYPNISTSKGEYKAKIIVGADGINSIVRKEMEIDAPKILGAAQIVAHSHLDADTVEIFIGSSIAPGFFAWRIPLFDDLAKIGLASYKSSWLYLKKLMKKLKVQPLSISGGGIPINTVERTYGKGTLIVGDAAGQVKATSGGGVYPGLMCAKCAIKAIKDALELGDYSENVLRGYETCWRNGIGKELKYASYLHRLYTKFRDDEFNKIIKILNDEKVIKIINDEGDIDYPSKVAIKIFRKKPSLMKYLSIPARPYRKRI